MQWPCCRTGPVKYERVTCNRSMMMYRARRPLIVGRKRRGNLSAIDVNNQGGFLGIVEALAHAHAKESGILFHQALRHLLLGGDGLVEHS